jgi:outer membrane murein-binding lipoprotein Lpp
MMKIKKIIIPALLTGSLILLNACESRTKVEVNSSLPSSASSNTNDSLKSNSNAPLSNNQPTAAATTPTEAARAMIRGDKEQRRRCGEKTNFRRFH